MTPSKGNKQAHIGLLPAVTLKPFEPVPFRVRGVNTGLLSRSRRSSLFFAVSYDGTARDTTASILCFGG